MNTSFENISAIYRDWLHSLGSQNFKGFHHKSQRLWTCCHHHRGAWWMTSILPERSQEVPNRIDRRAGVSSKVKSALWWWSDSRRWHYRVQKSWSQGKKWSPDQRIQIIQSLYISSHKLPSSCWKIQSDPIHPIHSIQFIQSIQSNPIQSNRASLLEPSNTYDGVCWRDSCGFLCLNSYYVPIITGSYIVFRGLLSF